MSDNNLLDLVEETKNFRKYLFIMEESYKNIGSYESRASKAESKIIEQFERLVSIVQPLKIDNHNLHGQLAVLKNEMHSLQTNKKVSISKAKKPKKES